MSDYMIAVLLEIESILKNSGLVVCMALTPPLVQWFSQSVSGKGHAENCCLSAISYDEKNSMRVSTI